MTAQRRQAHRHVVETTHVNITEIWLLVYQVHMMRHSPKAHQNFRKSTACKESPENNFFLLIGCSVTPAPLAHGLAYCSFPPDSHWLLTTIVDCHRLPMQVSMNIVCGPWLWCCSFESEGGKRNGILDARTRWWNFSQSSQLLAAPALSLSEIRFFWKAKRLQRENVLRKAERTENIRRVSVLQQRQK